MDNPKDYASDLPPDEEGFDYKVAGISVAISWIITASCVGIVVFAVNFCGC